MRQVLHCNLRGQYTQMPFLPKVLSFFLINIHLHPRDLHEISFNPKLLSYYHSASSHKSENFLAIFKVNVKKREVWGGGGLMNFKNILNRIEHVS